MAVPAVHRLFRLGPQAARGGDGSERLDRLARRRRTALRHAVGTALGAPRTADNPRAESQLTPMSTDREVCVHLLPSLAAPGRLTGALAVAIDEIGRAHV